MIRSGRKGFSRHTCRPTRPSVDAAYLDPNGKWTGWYIGIFGLVVNKDRWASEASTKAKPTSWDDLLDSDYQGKLVLPDPVKTGGGYIFLATQVFRFERDEDRAMEYMRQLNGNIGQYAGTSPQGIALVGQGQFLMGHLAPPDEQSIVATVSETRLRAGIFPLLDCRLVSSSAGRRSTGCFPRLPQKQPAHDVEAQHAFCERPSAHRVWRGDVELAIQTPGPLFRLVLRLDPGKLVGNKFVRH